MSYITIRDLANTHSVNAAHLYSFIAKQFSHLVFGNPDANLLMPEEANMIKTEHANHVASTFIRAETGNYATAAELDQLRETAVKATAEWLAASNKVNFIDFKIDMAKEPGIDPAEVQLDTFMTCAESVGDVLSTAFDDDVANLLPGLQK